MNLVENKLYSALFGQFLKKPGCFLLCQFSGEVYCGM